MTARYPKAGSLRMMPGTMLIAMLLWAATSVAQLSTWYIFSQSSGTFTEINGGTQLWNGTIQNSVSAAQTIPAFTFNGVTYTSMYVSTNGFITFGSAPATTEYTPISSSAGYTAAISAFGAQLSEYGPNNLVKDVRWQQVGAEVVVQWRNVRRFNLGSGNNSEHFSMQIRMNTTTGVVRIVYGGVTNLNNSTAFQPQVGLRGASNGDVSNRLVGTGTETWATSLAGANNASVMRFTSANPARSFASGQTYTWTPYQPPELYTTASGNFTDLLWALTPNGPATVGRVNSNVKAVIQTGHTITVSDDQNAADLDLEAGATLVLPSGTSLSLHGDLVDLDGTIQGTGELWLEGPDETTMTASGTITLGHLVVNTVNGTNLVGNYNITGSLRPDDGILDATAATVRLVSNIDGTARLGSVGATADYLGEIIMERYIPGGVTNWRMLGSAVAGRTVADWNDDFFTAGFPGSNYPNFYVNNELWPSIRKYDETVSSADLYDGLEGVGGTTESLQIGRGYAVWSGDALGGTQAFTVDVTGEPVIAQTPISLPMTYTNSGTAGADGWNLVSNPLPSPIAFSAISRGADVQNAYWIYNPTNGNNASWNGVIGTNGANGVIQSSQGFWLKASGTAVTTTIDENDKVAGNTGGLFGGPALIIGTLPLLRLEIASGMNTFVDEAVIVFDQGVPILDAGDVEKFVFSHPEAPQVATRSSDGHLLAINMYGSYNADIMIPVLVNVPVNGTYTITATQLDVIDGVSCLVLEDLVTGTITPLTADASYNFSVQANANDTIPRFMLHASAPVTHSASDLLCHGDSNGQIYTQIPATGATNVIWMDHQGNAIDSTETSSGNATIDGLHAGTYMVSVSTDAGCGHITATVAVEQPFALEAIATITDASCPGATDGMIEIEVLGGTAPHTMAWSNGDQGAIITAATGSYTVAVTDQNGCSLVQEELYIGSGEGPTADFFIEAEVILVGEEVSFFNNSIGADTWLWSFGDGGTSEGYDAQHTFTVPGLHTVTLTAIDGECSDIGTMEVNVQLSTDVATADEHVLAGVWSDGDRIFIDHTHQHGMLEVSVMDASGRIHIQQTMAASGGRMTIPADGLTTGIWLVQVSHEGNRQTFRVPLVR